MVDITSRPVLSCDTEKYTSNRHHREGNKGRGAGAPGSLCGILALLHHYRLDSVNGDKTSHNKLFVVMSTAHVFYLRQAVRCG